MKMEMNYMKKSMDQKNLNPNKKKYRFIMIATYSEMAKKFLKIAREIDIKAEAIDASFDEAVECAKERAEDIDIILSRGGTAQCIKEAVDIPVVFISITPFDVIQAIEKLDSSVQEIALFHFKEKIKNIQDIREMYNITIHEYTFINKKDIYEGIQDAKQKGITNIIGGEVAVRYAHSLGIRGIVISAGEYGVYHAVNEAIQILQEKQKENAKAARLSAAFGAIAEGVIVTDQERQIVIVNSAAEKIFGAQNKVGQKAANQITDRKYEDVLSKKENSAHYFMKIGKNMLAVYHYPIYEKKDFIGIVSTYENVTKIQKLESQIRNEMHMKGFSAKYTFDDIVTNDPGMIELKKVAKLFAQTDSSILIEGESGTGKELVAQSLHNASNRAVGPFVAINCAAIPESLLESELFGYASGAFTGAKKEGKPGMFELAHNGTIFLDEIGELSLILQTRLLRVLQEKEVMRIGGNKIIPIDVRVISATNKNLSRKVRENSFRGDLYYRLNVFSLKLPSLRMRKSDIPYLANVFLNAHQVKIEEETWHQYAVWMQEYNWPGNIRELQNIVERIAVLSNSDTDIDARDFIPLSKNEDSIPDIALIEGSEDEMLVVLNLENGLKSGISGLEKEVIKRMLALYNDDQDLVAEKLKIGKTTLWRKEKGYP